jgi:hypothetical protein
MSLTKILSNVARCLVCGDIIESTHVHDYQECNCGEISIDGGTEYLKRSARNLMNLEDLSIVDEVEEGHQLW